MRGRYRCLRGFFWWRRPGLCWIVFGLVWFYVFLSVMIFNRDLADTDSRHMREKIISLSKQYLKRAALEKGEAAPREADGSYDFQKPLAVLIENLAERVDYLETKVNGLTVGKKSRSTSELIRNGSQPMGYHRANLDLQQRSSFSVVTKDPRGAFVGWEEEPRKEGQVTLNEMEQGKCNYTEEELIRNPNCMRKVEWMRQFWKSDKCYGLRGVDGTDCSIFIYLSEVEKWCPRFSWRPKEQRSSKHSGPLAVIRKDKDGLFAMMDNPEKFRWMKMRISRMWDTLWIPAVEALEAKGQLAKRTQKTILIHLGLLTKESGFKIAEQAFSGGPLGELVQWADIITSLYILGHDINISYSTHRMTTYLRSHGLAKSSCPSESDMPFDMIYIDIVGLKQMRKASGGLFNQFKCMLRVIDSFGTEPAYNADRFSKTSGYRSSWGRWNLVPRQFMTMFPHTPDDSFMGFVVEHYPSKVSNPASPRDLRALVYGKDHKMWKDAESYLNIIHEKFEIHGTVYEVDGESRPQIPFYVHNHGIVNGSAIQKLLQETKLFIGLGFPYEGPAPLEAIANGCIFLNPSFNPHKNSKNTKFFEGKPTTRSFSSQHPYAETFIGKPHVWTVDIKDEVSLRKTIDEIGKVEAVEPYLPYEFTCEGMLQRLSAFTQHQDFCHSVDPMWPPVSALKIIPADDAVSCKQACFDLGLVCEPSFFPLLNKKEIIEENFSISCSVEEAVEDLYPPSLKAGRFRTKCQIQQNDILFSCAGEKAGVRRLCPCRDYIQGQVALCKDCL